MPRWDVCKKKPGAATIQHPAIQRCSCWDGSVETTKEAFFSSVPEAQCAGPSYKNMLDIPGAEK